MTRIVSPLFRAQPLDAVALALDCPAEVARIATFLRAALGRLHRRGAVIGISGGVDSAVCAALAVSALGQERVIGLLMPERESGADGLKRAQDLCAALGIPHLVEDITPALTALGCYERRDAAIRRLFPQYGPGYRQKITTERSNAREPSIPFFALTVQAPDGIRAQRRMPLDVYLDVIAASNMKQRTRKQVEYYHAERLNYAVIGTPNRLEYELGFFVRGGDGLADVKPIAHLYKSQVYALAAHLDVPAAIRDQPPSTDTYSLPQTQEEFYFALPYAQMDLVLYAFRDKIPAATIADALGLSVERVKAAYRDIVAKRRVAARGLQDAMTVEPVMEP